MSAAPDVLDMYDFDLNVDQFASEPARLSSLVSLEDLLGSAAPMNDWFGAGIEKGPLALLEAPPPTAQIDEAAAFVRHINSGDFPKIAAALPCTSPTAITDSLLTPKSKRSKPKAVRARKADPVAPAAVAAASDSEAGEAVAPDSPSRDGEPAPEEEPESEEQLEKTRYERMMRNRASAAQSRKRKKEHTEQLEALVASLRETKQKLQEENEALRLQCAAASSVADCGKADELVPPVAPQQLESPVAIPSASLAAGA